MSINLSDPNITSAYEDILWNRGSDWLLLTYGGTRDRLTLLSSGEGGIETLRQDIPTDGDDIFFGFCQERENGRNYFAIVAYVPENVSGVRRARALVHLRAVTGLLKNHHATLHVNKVADLTTENVRDRLKLGPTSIPKAPNSGRIQRSATEPFPDMQSPGMIESPPVRKSASEIRGSSNPSPIPPAMKVTKIPMLQDLPTPPRSEPAESPKATESPPIRKSVSDAPMPISPPPMLPPTARMGRITSLQGLEMPLWEELDIDEPPPTPAKDKRYLQTSKPYPDMANMPEIMPEIPPAPIASSATTAPMAPSAPSVSRVPPVPTTSSSHFHSRSLSKSELPYLSEELSGTDDEPSVGPGRGRPIAQEITRQAGRRGSEASTMSRPPSRPPSSAQTPAERARQRAEAAKQREAEEQRGLQEEAERQARLKFEKEEALKRAEEEEERRKLSVKEEKRRAAAERERREMERKMEDERRARELELKREAEREKRMNQARRLEKVRQEEKRRAEELKKQKEEQRKVAEEQKQERVKQIQDEFLSKKDAGTPLLAGNITVQTSTSIAWRRRFFELTENSLVFYKSSLDRVQPLDILHLTDGHVLAVKEPGEGYDELEAIPHSFALELDDDGPWCLFADSPEAKLILISLITQVAGL